MITLNQLLATSLNAAGGKTDPRIDPTAIINLCGDTLCRAAQWSWLQRPSVPLVFVEGQDHVPLPDDFGQIVSIEPDEDLNYDVELTTLASVEVMRRASVFTPLKYWVAVQMAPQVSATEEPKYQLAIWPEPASTLSGRLHLVYTGRWRYLTEGDQVANIPLKAELLLIMLCRSVIRGMHERKSELTVIGEFLESAVLRKAIEEDGYTQQNYGTSEGGIDQPGEELVYRPYQEISR